MALSETSRTAIQQLLIGNQALLVPFSEFCDLQAQFWANHALSELIKTEGKVDWQSVIRAAARHDVWNNIVRVIEQDTGRPVPEENG